MISAIHVKSRLDCDSGPQKINVENLILPRHYFCMADFILVIFCAVMLLEFRKQTAKIDEVLKKLNGSSNPGAESFSFYEIINGKKIKVEHMFKKVTESFQLAIEPKDAKGNLAKLDGKPEWALTDAAMGTLTVSEDGLSASFEAAGPLGVFKIQVSGDADLGEGVKTIMGELEVELVAGDAVTIEIKEVLPQ